MNDKAFERLKGYLKDGHVVFGGRTDRTERYFEPTVIDGLGEDSPAMGEESRARSSPIRTFKDTGEVISFVTSREKPLALYYFGGDGRTSSGTRPPAEPASMTR